MPASPQRVWPALREAGCRLTARKPGGFVGRSVLRREDQRLLLGKGQYVADIALPDMLHVVFVRSTLPHARVKSVDLSALPRPRRAWFAR